MDIFSISPAVDDENEQHISGEDARREAEYDQGLQYVSGRQLREDRNVAVPRMWATAVLQGWRY